MLHLPLIIDTDPALGLPLSDIDDALAIHALVKAGYPVAGLTTCFGNGSGEDVTRIACHLGDAYGLEVFEGAHRPGQVESAAVDRLVEHRGDVLAIGPLTNVAAALLRGASWNRLVVLGGTTRRVNLRPMLTTEFNFAMDPTAAQLALPHVDVLFPMEVCRQVLFDGTDLRGLPDWLAERCRHWVKLAPLMTGREGFHPWDLLPALYLLESTLFGLERRAAVASFGPLSKGRIRLTPGSTAVAMRVDSAGVRSAWRELVTG